MSHPEPGTIIDFAYEWSDSATGVSRGNAHRPCLIWRARKILGLSLVAVLPLSASATGARVPISPSEAKKLRLPENSQAVIEEANVFTWPSPFLKRPNGELPRIASRKLLNAIEEAMTGRQLTIVRRAEDPPSETHHGAA
ncbi:hypothetical protein [uncultured Roseovarius sp.]|uniref:hypothetical protein n=1 Tax=uncultured Roseovarius sp. TaxID=293344 RepID=UPI002632325B|nr:hypothetical protein [uncultured Roseovarius sp.]